MKIVQKTLPSSEKEKKIISQLIAVEEQNLITKRKNWS